MAGPTAFPGAFAYGQATSGEPPSGPLFVLPADEMPRSSPPAIDLPDGGQLSPTFKPISRKIESRRPENWFAQSTFTFVYPSTGKVSENNGIHRLSFQPRIFVRAEALATVLTVESLDDELGVVISRISPQDAAELSEALGRLASSATSAPQNDATGVIATIAIDRLGLTEAGTKTLSGSVSVLSIPAQLKGSSAGPSLSLAWYVSTPESPMTRVANVPLWAEQAAQLQRDLSQYSPLRFSPVQIRSTREQSAPTGGPIDPLWVGSADRVVNFPPRSGEQDSNALDAHADLVSQGAWQTFQQIAPEVYIVESPLPRLAIVLRNADAGADLRLTLAEAKLLLGQLGGALAAPFDLVISLEATARASGLPVDVLVERAQTDEQISTIDYGQIALCVAWEELKNARTDRTATDRTALLPGAWPILVSQRGILHPTRFALTIAPPVAPLSIAAQGPTASQPASTSEGSWPQSNVIADLASSSSHAVPKRGLIAYLTLEATISLRDQLATLLPELERQVQALPAEPALFREPAPITDQ